MMKNTNLYYLLCIRFVLLNVNVQLVVLSSSSCLEEILEKRKMFDFDIGMRCISILHYLIEFLDSLPLCAISRMLTVHDVPYLFTQLIEYEPWKKQNKDGNISLFNFLFL